MKTSVSSFSRSKTSLSVHEIPFDVGRQMQSNLSPFKSNKKLKVVNRKLDADSENFQTYQRDNGIKHNRDSCNISPIPFQTAKDSQERSQRLRPIFKAKQRSCKQQFLPPLKNYFETQLKKKEEIQEKNKEESSVQNPDTEVSQECGYKPKKLRAVRKHKKQISDGELYTAASQNLLKVNGNSSDLCDQKMLNQAISTLLVSNNNPESSIAEQKQLTSNSEVSNSQGPNRAQQISKHQLTRSNSEKVGLKAQIHVTNFELNDLNPNIAPKNKLSVTKKNYILKILEKKDQEDFNSGLREALPLSSSKKVFPHRHFQQKDYWRKNGEQAIQSEARGGSFSFPQSEFANELLMKKLTLKPAPIDKMQTDQIVKMAAQKRLQERIADKHKLYRRNFEREGGNQIEGSKNKKQGIKGWQYSPSSGQNQIMSVEGEQDDLLAYMRPGTQKQQSDFEQN